MWVESTVGEGSTFHFTIQVSPTDKQPVFHLPRHKKQLKNKSVLIVDDNETNRLILSKQTTSWGLHPTAVATGSEALTHLKEGKRFDVAILDMQMPKMDGVHLAKSIHHLLAEERPVLIMLSSLGQRLQPEINSLFDASLTKPAKPFVLHNTLLELLAGDKNEQQTDEDTKPLLDPNMSKEHPLRILLVEDNAINQKVALRTLERLGYRADVAANGLEALEALQRQFYNVILMDVQMPEMDGVEATRIIRHDWAVEAQPHIVAMTANALAGDREKYLEIGMDDYISKPVRIEELVAALYRCPPLPAGTQLQTKPLPARQQPAASPAVTDTWPIDKTAVDEMLGDSTEEMLSELVPLFFEDAHALLDKLHQALAEEDVEMVAQFAHTLKGSSATLGMLRFSELCRTVEKQAGSGEVEGLEEYVTAVVKEFELIEKVLT